MKIVLLVVLVLGKEPFEYDDENEDEYNPLDLASMITQGVRPPFPFYVVPLQGACKAFMKMQASRWPSRSVAAVARVKLVAARRSAPTLSPRPPFSSAVADLKRSWGIFMKMRLLAEGRAGDRCHLARPLWRRPAVFSSAVARQLGA